MFSLNIEYKLRRLQRKGANQCSVNQLNFDKMRPLLDIWSVNCICIKKRCPPQKKHELTTCTAKPWKKNILDTFFHFLGTFWSSLNSKPLFLKKPRRSQINSYQFDLVLKSKIMFWIVAKFLQSKWGFYAQLSLSNSVGSFLKKKIKNPQWESVFKIYSCFGFYY